MENCKERQAVRPAHAPQAPHQPQRRAPHRVAVAGILQQHDGLPVGLGRQSLNGLRQRRRRALSAQVFYWKVHIDCLGRLIPSVDQHQLHVPAKYLHQPPGEDSGVVRHAAHHGRELRGDVDQANGRHDADYVVIADDECSSMSVW